MTKMTVGGPGETAIQTLRDAEEALLNLKRIGQGEATAATSADDRAWVVQLTRAAITGRMPSGPSLAEDLADRQKTRELPGAVAALLICQGFCGDAIRAERAGDLAAAWRAAGYAGYWIGVSNGIASTVTDSARKHYEAWMNTQRARGRWGDNAVAKAWAKDAFSRDKTAYRSVAEFARYAERYVLTTYGVTVTASHIRDNWLKEDPPKQD